MDPEETAPIGAEAVESSASGDPSVRYEMTRILAALKALLGALVEEEAGEGEQAAWAAAAVHWTGVMSRDQRRFLLEAAIAACAADDAVEILEAELARLTEAPGPALARVKDEAKAWAFFAPAPVVKAYLVACFRALPKKDQIAALPALQRFALK